MSFKSLFTRFRGKPAQEVYVPPCPDWALTELERLTKIVKWAEPIADLLESRFSHGGAYLVDTVTLTREDFQQLWPHIGHTLYLRCSQAGSMQ